ncbi:hypothetical protein LINGRAHAP2_LOCUS22490 [Linum grandiflorum]
MGDNEGYSSDWEHGHGGSDTDDEQSVVTAHFGVIHLISDSDRTTDLEFLEAMVNMGVATRRRRIRVNIPPKEVEEINVNAGAELFPGINDIAVDLPPPVTDEDMYDDDWDDNSSEDADYEPSGDQTETESSEDELLGVDASNYWCIISYLRQHFICPYCPFPMEFE